MTDYLDKDLFGFTDDNDKSLQASSKGEFGLNQKVFIEDFKVEKGEDGKPYILFSLKVDDGIYQRRFYELDDKIPVKGKYYPKGTPEYMKAAKLRAKDFAGTMTHIFKALGVSAEDLKEALKDGAKGIIDYFKKIEPLLPPNYKEIPLDVFLQYQYKIREGQDRTFLELPWGMKDGYWITRHVEPVGEWKMEKSDNGIRYVDEAGNVHPLEKGKTFVKSGKAEMKERKVQESSEDDDLWG